MEQLIARFDSLLGRLVDAAPAVIAIILGAIVVMFLVNRGIRLLAKHTSLAHRDLAPLMKMFNWALIGVTLILLLGALGFNLGGLWTMLSTVLAMVAIGFVAVWSVLSNASCTLMILVFRPFGVGDIIEIANEPIKGRVIDLNFLYTTLATEDEMLIQIPNNLFFQKAIKRRRGTSHITLAEQLARTKPEA